MAPKVSTSNFSKQWQEALCFFSHARTRTSGKTFAKPELVAGSLVKYATELDSFHKRKGEDNIWAHVKHNLHEAGEVTLETFKIQLNSNTGDKPINAAQILAKAETARNHINKALSLLTDVLKMKVS